MTSRRILILSTTAILTSLIAAPAFAGQGVSCLVDTKGNYVDAQGNLMNETQMATCLNQQAPAAGDDDGGDEPSEAEEPDAGDDYVDPPSSEPEPEVEEPPAEEETPEETPEEEVPSDEPPAEYDCESYK